MLIRETFKTRREAMFRIKNLEDVLLNGVVRRIIYNDVAETEIYSFGKDFSIIRFIVRPTNTTNEFELLYEI